ncbi:MAG: beta-lactamase family protein, partial [Spirochaetales bacterium]|nr:beta-lactamase family protein [Spirochaetales bacterium]
HHGALAYSRYGGSIDAAGRVPVSPSTPFMVYSLTKTFVAVAIHRLAAEGKLDLDAPVARYWPSFGRHGKDDITAAHLLTHTAGIPGPARVVDVLSWIFPAMRGSVIEGLRPVSEPGVKCEYHMFTAHVALGELLRRIDGRDPGRYIREELLEPLGLSNSHAGLPLSQYRHAARVYSGDPRQNDAARVFSSPMMRSIFLPAASINAPALVLAAFYSALLDAPARRGSTVLPADALAEATKLRYDGQDGDLDQRIRWSRGFSLGGIEPFPDSDVMMMGRNSTERTFGHAGQGGCSLAWADPDADVAFAFVCNRFLPSQEAHRRLQELSDQVWAAL